MGKATFVGCQNSGPILLLVVNDVIVFDGPLHACVLLASLDNHLLLQVHLLIEDHSVTFFDDIVSIITIHLPGVHQLIGIVSLDLRLDVGSLLRILLCR